MGKSSGRPSLGKRRSEREGWEVTGVGPQKRAKACHSSESKQHRPWPDVGDNLIEANTPGSGDRTVSTPSSGTSSSESINRASSTPLTIPSQGSPTHDNIRAKYHIKDVASFATALEQAASGAFPNQGRSRYATINVCLIRWEEDEIEEILQVKPEVERLREVFRDIYGFNTEIWHIPTIRSHHKLMGKALDFIEEFDQNDNLFVVYYAGHGTMNEHRQSVWTCRRDLQDATVDWSSIHSLFSKAFSDVLVLLDCCAAASAATTSGNGVLETIAACGFEGIAPPPGRFSFTNTLTDVLRDWNAKPSFSVTSLHAEILFQLKSKSLERGRSGGPRMEWCRTPVHFIYSSDPKTPSIELSRREPRAIMDQNGVETVFQRYSPRLTSYHDSAIMNFTRQENLENALTSLTPTGDLTVPHVLISVALEESQERLDLESWRRWLTGFPALVKYARIQGAYKSYSTLLILALPVMIWDMLPGNPACCFIGYVASENMWTSRSRTRSVDTPTSSLPPPPRGDKSLLHFQDTGISSAEFLYNNSGDTCPRTREKYVSEQAGTFDSINNGPWASNLEEQFSPKFSTTNNSTLTPADKVLVDSDSEAQIKALEVLKVLRDSGYRITPDRACSSMTKSTYDENQVVCQVCKKFKGRPAELKKHMKRHERPYGCTFSACHKTFGSKNDWKRHENSQHFHLECWRCSETNQDEAACAKVCYRRQTYQDHLSKEHKITDAEVVKEKLDSTRLGRNYQVRFWCGFCVKPVELKKKGFEAWAERFDHIDDHFMGRHGLAKQSIREWVAVDAGARGKDDCGDLSDACSLPSAEE